MESGGLERASIWVGLALLLGAGVLLLLPSTVPERPAAGEGTAESSAAPERPTRTSTRALDPEPPEDSQPDRDDEAKPFFDEAGEPSRDFVKAALEAAISEHLPGLKLSSEERERLTESVVRLRDAQRTLRELPRTAEHAEKRRALRDEIASASAAFEEVVDMTPGEFTASVQPGVGIDTYSPDEEIPEAEYLDDLP